ncbi:MAG: hypothetical protein JWR42_329 [Marmoricola sp.]|nr:hypothetical protein [Marmoricola sp.]
MAIDFLNTGTAAVEGSVVKSPAFSLTKVMAVVAPLVTLVTTTVTSWLKDAAFTPGQITTIIVALIAFLALTGSADVLARAVASYAQASGEAATASATTAAGARNRSIQFAKPFAARLRKTPTSHMDVHVLGASDATPHEYLCLMEDGSVEWSPAVDVEFQT